MHVRATASEREKQNKQFLTLVIFVRVQRKTVSTRTDGPGNTQPKCWILTLFYSSMEWKRRNKNGQTYWLVIKHKVSHVEVMTDFNKFDVKMYINCGSDRSIMNQPQSFPGKCGRSCHVRLSRVAICVSSKHGNRWPKRNGRILDRCGSVYNKTFSKNNTPSRKGRDAHISGLFILNILETWNKSVKSTAKQIWLCFRYASHSIHDVPVMINNGVIGCVCVCVWETRNDFDRDEFHEVVAKRGNWLWNFEEILCATTESESFF